MNIKALEIAMHSHSRFPRIVFAAFVLLGLLVLPAPISPVAHAAGYVVTKTADTNDGTCDSDCSLREAITVTNVPTGADTITFSVSGSITLGSPLPAIDDDLTIDGTGQNITVDGAGTYRVFSINSGKTVTLNALTITNGKTGGEAGGILNRGTLNVTNSTISNNSAVGDGTYGGGIRSFGALSVTNSTFFNNKALGAGLNGAFGGGISNSGTLQVFNSTFSDNNATETTGGPQLGGGIYNQFGTATLENTIIANSTSGGDCYLNSGTLTADENNIDSDGSCGLAATWTTPQIALGALADNGGPTQTMALGNSSVAIDAGKDSVCAAAPVHALDQRGEARNDLQCDVGAFELVFTDSAIVVNDRATDGETFTFGPTLAQIKFASGTPFYLLVQLLTGAPANTPPADALPLTWDLSQGCFRCDKSSPAPDPPSTLSLDVTFCYDTGVLTGQNENTLHVFHYNGSTWDDFGGVLDIVSHAPYHCVAATTPVTSLSPFVLAPKAPTAVDVTRIKGLVNKLGNVVLRWKTTNETQIAGFNIYRLGKQGKWKKINSSLRQAKHAGAASGDKYRFKDRGVSPGKTYRYQIEIVYLDGHTARTGVIRVSTP